MTVSITKAREFLKAKKRQRQERLDRLSSRAASDCEAIVSMIIERYNPIRIYQWGSLVDRSRFREYSDIDLAVEGIGGPEDFFGMLGEAEKMTDFSLDIVDMDKIEPEFADIIRQKGKVIYECRN